MPVSGNDFLAVTVNLTKSSETLIVSQSNQEFGTTASFNVEAQTTLSFQIDPTGFMADFNEIKL